MAGIVKKKEEHVTYLVEFQLEIRLILIEILI